MEIRLLPNMCLDRDGRLTNMKGDLIHLRQGDMDGACGPYCVVMSLLARNKAARDAFLPLEGIDYRTRVGRMLKSLHSADPLVLGGMDEDQIEKLFTAHNTATVRPRRGTGRELLADTSKAIQNGTPVMLCIQSRKAEGVNHWTLAVGVCSKYIYLLDPSYDLSIGSYWNAMISVTPEEKKKTFAYRYVNPWKSLEVKINVTLEVS